MHGIDKAKIQSYMSQSAKSKLDGWQSFDSCEGEKCGTGGAAEEVVVEEVAENGADVDVTEVVVADQGNGTTFTEECQTAMDNVANESNAIKKLPLIIECESECKGEEGAVCGFLVNGLSMILFALLAALKY